MSKNRENIYPDYKHFLGFSRNIDSFDMSPSKLTWSENIICSKKYGTFEPRPGFRKLTGTAAQPFTVLGGVRGGREGTQEGLYDMALGDTFWNTDPVSGDYALQLVMYPTTLVEGDTATFDTLTSMVDLGIATLNWQYAWDGVSVPVADSTGAASTITHVYPDFGTYTCLVWGTGTGGIEYSNQITFDVNEYEPEFELLDQVTIDTFDASPDSFVSAPGTTTLSWTTTAATAVTLTYLDSSNEEVVLEVAEDGQTDVTINTGTYFTLTADGPQGPAIETLLVGITGTVVPEFPPFIGGGGGTGTGGGSGGGGGGGGDGPPDLPGLPGTQFDRPGQRNNRDPQSGNAVWRGMYVVVPEEVESGEVFDAKVVVTGMKYADEAGTATLWSPAVGGDIKGTVAISKATGGTGIIQVTAPTLAAGETYKNFYMQGKYMGGIPATNTPYIGGITKDKVKVVTEGSKGKVYITVPGTVVRGDTFEGTIFATGTDGKKVPAVNFDSIAITVQDSGQSDVLAPANYQLEAGSTTGAIDFTITGGTSTANQCTISATADGFKTGTASTLVTDTPAQCTAFNAGETPKYVKVKIRLQDVTEQKYVGEFYSWIVPQLAATACTYDTVGYDIIVPDTRDAGDPAKSYQVRIAISLYPNIGSNTVDITGTAYYIYDNIPGNSYLIRGFRDMPVSEIPFDMRTGDMWELRGTNAHYQFSISIEEWGPSA